MTESLWDILVAYEKALALQLEELEQKANEKGTQSEAQISYDCGFFSTLATFLETLKILRDEKSFIPLGEAQERSREAGKTLKEYMHANHIMIDEVEYFDGAKLIVLNKTFRALENNKEDLQSEAKENDITIDLNELNKGISEASQYIGMFGIEHLQIPDDAPKHQLKIFRCPPIEQPTEQPSCSL